jgi:hypothetical protein
VPNRALELLVVVILVAWLLGWVVLPLLGKLIHLLLIVLAVVVIWRLLQGRRPLD